MGRWKNPYISLLSLIIMTRLNDTFQALVVIQAKLLELESQQGQVNLLLQPPAGDLTDIHPSHLELLGSI